MGKRRERLQIIYDILKVIMDRNGRIKPTHILYKANLSPKTLKESLTELIDKRFIIELQESSGKKYSLTEKGREFLEKYRTITEFTDSFGLT